MSGPRIRTLAGAWHACLRLVGERRALRVWQERTASGDYWHAKWNGGEALLEAAADALVAAVRREVAAERRGR